MKVSTLADYASRVLLSLVLHGDGQTPRPVREVADITGLPQPYLEQILLALKRNWTGAIQAGGRRWLRSGSGT